MTPDSPPITNIVTVPIENSMGVSKRRSPRHSVAIQLKIFTPVGIAMITVEMPNAVLATGPRPVANMWCAHTPKPMNPIAIPLNTTNW